MFLLSLFEMVPKPSAEVLSSALKVQEGMSYGAVGCGFKINELIVYVT